MENLTINLLITLLMAAVNVGVAYGILKNNQKHFEQKLVEVGATIDKLESAMKEDMGFMRDSLTRREGGLKEDIKRLEVKMDKHNGIVERVIRSESRIDGAFARIDELRENQRKAGG
jgi:glutathionyl-hydroquinone reductase